MSSKSDQPESERKPSEREPSNVSVYVIKPRTIIRKAMCGKGRLSFPLTAAEAKTLETLGKVRVLGTA